VAAGCILLNCSSHRKIEIPIDRAPYESLQKEALISEIQNQTAEYQKLGAEIHPEKPYLELTLGYLNYQMKSLKEAENYFTKTLASSDSGDSGDFLLREYALYYLGQMKLESGQCKDAGVFHRELLEKYPESAAKNRLEKVWRELCEPKKDLSLPPHLNLYERALKNYRDKNYSIAIRQFQKFLNSVGSGHPKVEPTLEKLFAIYKRLNDKKKQFRYLTLLSRYQKADPQKFPYSPKWLLELAKFHWNREQPQIAQKIYSAFDRLALSSLSFEWLFHSFKNLR
jgi:tetratricopeptide (TPR) repeat protein